MATLVDQIQTVGRYNVLHPLGLGESDVVYLAEDPILMRHVAVKVMRGGGLGAEQARERFRREAELAAGLKHPNVVAVLEVGEDPVVGPFLVTELVDGTSLSDALTEGRLDTETCLRILLQVMRALEAAHAGGFIHCHLTPQKVLVSREHTAKVTGFATTEATMSAPATDGAETGYAPPEEIGGGERSEATNRYAFAAMALEVMTSGASETSTAIPDAAVSAVGVARLAKDSPMQAVFTRALATDPGERYPDLRSFMADLIEAAPLETPVRSQLLAALAVVRAAISDTAGLVDHRAVTAAEQTGAGGYRRALILALLGMGAIAILAWISIGLLRAVPEPTPARPLFVISTPEGAAIAVDGKGMGNTPRRVRVSSEARVLHLEKKGYKPVDYDLGAGSDEVRIVLESLPQPPHVTHPGESPPSPVAAATEAEPEPPPMEEPGGFLVVLGRSFRDVGERIAGIGEALRGWLAPKDTP